MKLMPDDQAIIIKDELRFLLSRLVNRISTREYKKTSQLESKSAKKGIDSRFLLQSPAGCLKLNQD